MRSVNFQLIFLEKWKEKDEDIIHVLCKDPSKMIHLKMFFYIQIDGNFKLITCMHRRHRYWRLFLLMAQLNSTSISEYVKDYHNI